METVQLQQGLTFLIYSAGVMFIIIGIMLVKLLFDLSVLSRNVNETTTIIKTELEPTLKNINKSVEIVSGIIIKADEGVNKFKDFFSKSPLRFLGKLAGFTGKAAKGFMDGLFTAFKMFSKR